VLIPEYQEVGARIENVINKYGLKSGDHRKGLKAWSTAKEIDIAMLFAEKEALFSRDGIVWRE
jgi:hypothetical protein